jgi:release factor family 3
MTQTTWLQNPSNAKDSAASIIKSMVNEKGKTCVSIIVPTHRIAPSGQGDRLEVQRAIIAAKEIVSNKPGNFLLDIDSLFDQIDFNKNKEGVGIFVSPNIKKILSFPFPVTRKIVVNNFFHLHDLIYIENYQTDYYLLDISKKEIHLFRGMLDHLEEIKDKNFPKKIVDDYEYGKPSRSNSGSGYAHVKDVEKDKSTLRELRLKKIFQVTDKLLSKYINTKDIPLLLCGPTEDISIYRSATKHTDNIITSMSDNYKGSSVHDLALLAWLQVRSFIDERKLKLVDDLKEKFGEGLAICGIDGIWPATKEGRGRLLLVEKDYGKMGLITKDDQLFLHGSGEKPVRYSDVIDEIINTVLEKNGKVVIMEKGGLEGYGGIALMLRY